METNNFKLEITNVTGITEVTQPSPETLEQKLNRFCVECGYNNISTSAIQILREEGQESGTTIIFNREENAYQLGSPVATRIAMYGGTGRTSVPVDYIGIVALKRILVGYSSLSRINTAIDMQRIMGPLINEGVKDFIDEFGSLGLGYKIRATQPGRGYFTDLDDYAAMEFRLYLYKE